MRFVKGALSALVISWMAGAALAEPFDWGPAREESVVEILTSDVDGTLRETPVWIVVIDAAAYVRTNDSKWLANIRRGSAVRLRVRDIENAVRVTPVTDAALTDRVEASFKVKYGMTQRLMSLFRMREPTVLKLAPLAP